MLIKIEEMEEFLKNKIEELTFEAVESNDSLIESAILDSLTVVDLAVFIENEYRGLLKINVLLIK